MDHQTLGLLIGTAAFLGCFHTVTGPDHFVPFIAMARIGRWSLRRTMAITLACGVGHVLSSVVLGSVGICLGLVVEVQSIEESRGNLAGWLLLGFGLAYTVWGVVRAIRNRPHRHFHAHVNGTAHHHDHAHDTDHAHVHAADQRERMTPWILFTIFVFGPCEVLIPMVMVPAANHSVWGVVAVTLAFGVATLATMLGIVVGAYLGLAKFTFPRLERFSHALAGSAILTCGVLVQFGGL